MSDTTTGDEACGRHDRERKRQKEREPTLPKEEVEGEEEEEEGCRRLCWEEEQEEVSFCKKMPADAEVM